MFANDDNEKTIKTYASLLQDIREAKDTYTHHVTDLMIPERGDHPEDHAKWKATKAKAKESSIKITRLRDQSKAESGEHYTFTGKNRKHVTDFMSNTVGFDHKNDKGNGLHPDDSGYKHHG